MTTKFNARHGLSVGSPANDILDSAGNISAASLNISGSITATNFVGSFSGTVTGTASTATAAAVAYSTIGTHTAGTGLNLIGTTFSVADTAVTAGSYGNASYVATYTVNQQGQLTYSLENAVENILPDTEAQWAKRWLDKKGIINIEDVVIGDEVLTSKGYRKIKNVFNQGIQQLIKLKTHNGEFKCTANHKMMVFNENNYEELYKIQLEWRNNIVDEKIKTIKSKTHGKSKSPV